MCIAGALCKNAKGTGEICMDFLLPAAPPLRETRRPVTAQKGVAIENRLCYNHPCMNTICSVISALILAYFR